MLSSGRSGRFLRFHYVIEVRFVMGKRSFELHPWFHLLPQLFSGDRIRLGWILVRARRKGDRIGADESFSCAIGRRVGSFRSHPETAI